MNDAHDDQYMPHSISIIIPKYLEANKHLTLRRTPIGRASSYPLYIVYTNIMYLHACIMNIMRALILL